MESCPKKSDCGARADMKCRSSTLQRCSAVPPGGPGRVVGRRLNAGVWASGSGAPGAFPWAPALMGAHNGTLAVTQSLSTVLSRVGRMCALPSVPLLQAMGRCPIPQERRPRAQLRSQRRVAPGPGRSPSVAFPFPPRHCFPSYVSDSEPSERGR